MKAICIYDPDADRSNLPWRPVKGVQLDSGFWCVEDPVVNEMVRYPSEWGEIVGDWEEESPFSLGSGPVTWSQYAKHQLGQVLRQNDLVDDLRDLGIKRDLEPYIRPNDNNSYKYEFRLTFNELDTLLARIPMP